MSEGAVGRRYAMRRGVPDSAILVESEGRTTSASLRAVARMLRQDSTGAITSTRRPRVILVSDPFHMLRIAVVAHRVGLRPHTSPTRTSPIDERREIFWRYVISESWKAPLAFVLERDPQSPAAP